MKVTVHFEGKNKGELISNIRAVADELEGKDPNQGELELAEKPKRGRPAKKTAPADEALEEAELELGEESEGEEEFSLDDDGITQGEDGAPTVVAKKETKPKGPTVEDMLTGFKTYAKKHGTEKAKAILVRLKVKNVREIAEKDYAKVLKHLNA